jgi:hypothetical protein
MNPFIHFTSSFIFVIIFVKMGINYNEVNNCVNIANNIANVVNNIQPEPLFAGRIELISGSLWSSAIEEFQDISEGKTVLVKWTVNTNNRRLTIYTLEKKAGQWERWIRVWQTDNFPTFWDYIYCNNSPENVELEDHNRDLVCSACYELE